MEFDENGDNVRTPDHEFINVPLRVVLYFESGKRVDRNDQDIFRFVGNEYDSIVIRAETRKVDISFRLEKVHRVYAKIYDNISLSSKGEQTKRWAEIQTTY